MLRVMGMRLCTTFGENRLNLLPLKNRPNTPKENPPKKKKKEKKNNNLTRRRKISTVYTNVCRYVDEILNKRNTHHALRKIYSSCKWNTF